MSRFTWIRVAGLMGLLLGTLPAIAASGDWPTPKFSRVMVVILENTDESDAYKLPFLGQIAREGAYLQNFFAIRHPSQPNYIALTSGSTHRVASNDNVNLDVRHLGDLLEAKGLSWKAYAEGYPGDCFLGATYRRFVRKHVPFLSYVNVQKNRERCAKVVNAGELRRDIESGTLPAFSLYIPDNDNNGHDTSPEYADRWAQRTVGPWIKDPRFMKDMLLVLTYDEGSERGTNQIYALLYGDSVKSGSRSSARYSLYDLLRTVEANFGLGTLGQEDSRAAPISGIWR